MIENIQESINEIKRTTNLDEKDLPISNKNIHELKSPLLWSDIVRNNRKPNQLLS